MSNVTDLFPKQTQHGTGDAFCIGCSHEWVAVGEAGTVSLQCPSCRTFKKRGGGALSFFSHRQTVCWFGVRVWK